MFFVIRLELFKMQSETTRHGHIHMKGLTTACFEEIMIVQILLPHDINSGTSHRYEKRNWLT